jgi:hypothetical protein
MRHPHVRVYTNDHADVADLVADYRCQDVAEAQQRMLALIQAYTDQVGVQEDMGEVVDFTEADAVTLWPQDQALTPLHLSIHFCEQPHEREAGTGAACAEA